MTNFDSLSPVAAASIEQGYFIFTLMPSLKCKLNCPHCYLSKDQRGSDQRLSIEDIKEICLKIHRYYEGRNICSKTIVCYWYGGEPLQYEKKYFSGIADCIESIFTEEAGYKVKHTILSSLINIDDEWLPILNRYGDGYIQTSFDGSMRGDRYVSHWENNVRYLSENGFKIGTISVVNRLMLYEGAKSVLSKLIDLGVVEASFLPFMLNDQNKGESYDRFAPSVNEYSKFMIELSKLYFEYKKQGIKVPEIGQLRFILGQSTMVDYGNMAGQTLFLMPDGQMVLPDYKDGYVEYMHSFGNILDCEFNEILNSPERRAYLRRQFLKNGNPECIGCEHSGNCIMEFWKPNRPGDDCFGARKYVDWLYQHHRDYALTLRHSLLH